MEKIEGECWNWEKGGRFSSLSMISHASYSSNESQAHLKFNFHYLNPAVDGPPRNPFLVYPRRTIVERLKHDLRYFDNSRL